MHTTDARLRPPLGGRTPLGDGTPQEAPAARDPGESQVEIVVPVRNEERDLEPAVRRLRAFLDDSFPFPARITIADNGSTDGTWDQASELAAEFPLVHVVHIDRPGRGGALRTIWTGSDADIYAYMDVDLSTDLNALLPLVAPLLSGHSDVAIGTRLARGARVIRGPKREIISRCYNLLLHASLGTRFSDAQCGFKAIRADAARALLPLTTDTGWFFDTELLVLAERAGLRIHEVPVDWIDDADSRVNVMATALGDLRGIVRLGTGLARGTISVPALRSAGLGPPGDGPGHGADHSPGPRSKGLSTGLSADRKTGPHGRRLAGQLTRFVLIGVASTVAYVLLYVLLRGVLTAQAADALSLLLTAMVNTAVNRRVTFGIRGRTNATRHQVRGLIAFAIGLALTSSALAALHASAPRAGRTAELTVLVAANLTATLVRFGLYRSWVFRHPTPSTGTSGPEGDPR